MEDGDKWDCAVVWLHTVLPYRPLRKLTLCAKPRTAFSAIPSKFPFPRQVGGTYARKFLEGDELDSVTVPTLHRHVALFTRPRRAVWFVASASPSFRADAEHISSRESDFKSEEGEREGKGK